jgi:hypothetical protein
MNRHHIQRFFALMLSATLLVACASCASGTRRIAAAAAHPAAAPSTPAAAPLSGPAVAKYGQAAVQKAYKSMLAFTFDNGWNPKLILRHVDSVTRADFAQVLAAMTPQCAATFTAKFAKVAQHDKAAIRSLEGAIFFGITGPKGIRPSRASGLVTDRTYSQVALGIDTFHGVDRLTLAFTAKANVHLTDAAGKGYVLPTARAVHYLLVPNRGRDSASKPFLIGAWDNTLTASRIQPVH